MFLHIDDPLVFGAAEGQADIFFLQHEFSVHQDVQTGEHFVRTFASGAAFGKQVALQGIAGIAPDGFLWEPFPHPSEEGKQGTLICRLKGLAAEQGESVDIIRSQPGQDPLLRFFVERLSVGKIPGFGIEAFFTMMGTTGNEEGDPNSLSVCNITDFDSP